MERKVFDITFDPFNAELKDVKFPIGAQILAINTFDAGFGERGTVFTVFGTDDPKYQTKAKLVGLKRGETFDEGDRMSNAKLKYIGVAEDKRYPNSPSDVFYFMEV